MKFNCLRQTGAIATGTSAVILASFLGMTADAAQASTLIQNGGFESGDFSSWSETGNIEITTGIGGVCCRPSEGTYFVDFNGGNRPPNGTLSQTFSTIPGSEYLLSFDFTKAGIAPGTAQLDIEIDGIQTLLSEVVSDTTGGHPGEYANFSFLFTADSTSTTLTFEDTSIGTANFDALVDNVSVTSTPEPSLLLGLGTLALAGGTLLRRKRH